MSETLIGVWGIVALFLCLVARVPVGMALLVVGFGGIWVIDGQRTAIATLSSETYSSITAYSLSIIPLFVLIRLQKSRCACQRLSRNLMSASRSSGAMPATASRCGCASPPCQSVASSNERARPS